MIKKCLICGYNFNELYLFVDQVEYNHSDYILFEYIGIKNKQLCFDFYNGEIY